MIISPSILSLHYEDFKDQINALNESVEWIHFDVMDGNFVPNISFGPAIFKTFRKYSNLYMDVHLMVNDPGYYTDVFAKAGADGITFHYESYNNQTNCEFLIDKIHGYYLKAGISIRPNTDVEVLYPLLDKVDLVLIMSVEPGFGGQEFIPSSFEKIEKLNNYRKEHNLNYLIQVDGGINDFNAYDVISKGADSLVAGSFIFDGDIKKNVESLRKVEKSY